MNQSPIFLLLDQNLFYLQRRTSPPKNLPKEDPVIEPKKIIISGSYHK